MSNQSAYINTGIKSSLAILTRLNNIENPAIKYGLFLEAIRGLNEFGINMAKTAIELEISEGEDMINDLEEIDDEEWIDEEFKPLDRECGSSDETIRVHENIKMRTQWEAQQQNRRAKWEANQKKRREQDIKVKKRDIEYFHNTLENMENLEKQMKLYYDEFSTWISRESTSTPK